MAGRISTSMRPTLSPPQPPVHVSSVTSAPNPRRPAILGCSGCRVGWLPGRAVLGPVIPAPRCHRCTFVHDRRAPTAAAEVGASARIEPMVAIAGATAMMRR